MTELNLGLAGFAPGFGLGGGMTLVPPISTKTRRFGCKQEICSELFVPTVVHPARTPIATTPAANVNDFI